MPNSDQIHLNPSTSTEKSWIDEDIQLPVRSGDEKTGYPAEMLELACDSWKADSNLIH